MWSQIRDVVEFLLFYHQNKWRIVLDEVMLRYLIYDVFSCFFLIVGFWKDDDNGLRSWPIPLLTLMKNIFRWWGVSVAYAVRYAKTLKFNIFLVADIKMTLLYVISSAEMFPTFSYDFHIIFIFIAYLYISLKYYSHVGYAVTLKPNIKYYIRL